MQQLFPEFAAVCDMFAKFSTLYALEILNIMRDYNEIYLSIFSVFHEIMLRAKWTSRNDDRISTFRGSLQGGPYCTTLCMKHNLKSYFYLLGKGGYVFGSVGLSVCLFVCL